MSVYIKYIMIGRDYFDRVAFLPYFCSNSIMSKIYIYIYILLVNRVLRIHVRDGGAGISSLLSFRNRYTVQPKPRHNQPILVGIFAQGALGSLYIIALIIFHD